MDPNNTQNVQGGAQKEDYVDKGKLQRPLPSPLLLHFANIPSSLVPAFDFGAKKSGHSVPRETAEKITDAGRGLYEKATGKKVNPKISN